MLLMVPLLVALDHYSGFKETATWREDGVDGMVAYGVGVAGMTAAGVLAPCPPTTPPPPPRRR